MVENRRRGPNAFSPAYTAAVDELGATNGPLIIGGKSMGGPVANMIADQLFDASRVAELLVQPTDDIRVRFVPTYRDHAWGVLRSARPVPEDCNKFRTQFAIFRKMLHFSDMTNLIQDTDLRSRLPARVAYLAARRVANDRNRHPRPIDTCLSILQPLTISVRLSPAAFIGGK